jgi:hypothetical protein
MMTSGDSATSRGEPLGSLQTMVENHDSIGKV